MAIAKLPVKQSPSDIHLEHELLKGKVDGIQEKLGQLGTILDSIQKDLQGRPRASNYRDIIASVVSTLIACGLVIGLANWWQNTALDPVRHDLSALTKLADPGKLAVLEYRLCLVENKKVCS